MRRVQWMVVASGFLWVGIASAEVLESHPNAFAVRTMVDVALAPDAAFARFMQPAQWWIADHTFGGDATQLSMTLQSRCFCETLANQGIVEHARITYAAPGKQLILRGGFGPLATLSVNAVWTIAFVPIEGGTRVTATYRVSGEVPGAIADFAGPVDAVLSAQLERFKDIESP